MFVKPNFGSYAHFVDYYSYVIEGKRKCLFLRCAARKLLKYNAFAFVQILIKLLQPLSYMASLGFFRFYAQSYPQVLCITFRAIKSGLVFWRKVGG